MLGADEGGVCDELRSGRDAFGIRVVGGGTPDAADEGSSGGGGVGAGIVRIAGMARVVGTEQSAGVGCAGDFMLRNIRGIGSVWGRKWIWRRRIAGESDCGKRNI